MTAPLCFIDTETDGVHPDRKVWEVAMIRRDDYAQREIQFYVDIDLSTADPFGLKIGGFYDRHPVGKYLAGVEVPRPMRGVTKEGAATPLIYAAEQVAKWTHGAHLVGAVPNFDAEVLSGLLRSQGLAPAWHYHLIDVENLAVGYLSRKIHENEALGYTDSSPIPMPWKSDDLSRACDVEPASDEERHTALGDARWAMRLYDAITGSSDGS